MSEVVWTWESWEVDKGVESEEEMMVDEKGLMDSDDWGLQVSKFDLDQ